jgi:hypothetical protein
MVLVAIGVGDDALSFGGGRYLDRLERRDGRWGIVDRMITVEWWNDPDALTTFGSLAQQATRDRSDPSYTRPLRVTRSPRDLAAPADG